MAISFTRTVPILRIFDVEKAKEFYTGYLGFHVDWEHRFPDAVPVYMQVSRAGLLLHLSEHYGDGTPGSAVYGADRKVWKSFIASSRRRTTATFAPGSTRRRGTPWP